MSDAKITQVYSAINFLLKYNQYLNPTDNKIDLDLKLQIIKKY